LDENTFLVDLLSKAFIPRILLESPGHDTAFRLFNGFLEGDPDLVLDIYGNTLLVHNYAGDPVQGEAKVPYTVQTAQFNFPWIETVVLKTRNSPSLAERQGKVIQGDHPCQKIQENGVWYALDLFLNQDPSFYLDTRNLRIWSKEKLQGKSALNTFAYTGSLGVAALSGGAQKVIQTDLKEKFLNLARKSYRLNGLNDSQSNLMVGDFWTVISCLKRQGTLLDCVFLDPPFYAASSKGLVDLVNQGHRMINKVRPLIKDGGWLVSINNALFLSGQDYIRMLERLCADGYLSLEEIIPVPDDLTGYPQTRLGFLPSDPTPFNHSTKIAILHVKKKPKTQPV
jgi:23S rRNA (cytosine1962-C5)-methyltransferase